MASDATDGVVPAQPIGEAIKNAKPFDWVSVALAFSIPALVVLEPYLSATPNEHLPPVGTSLLVATLGTLISQLRAMQKRRGDDASQ